MPNDSSRFCNSPTSRARGVQCCDALMAAGNANSLSHRHANTHDTIGSVSSVSTRYASSRHQKPFQAQREKTTIRQNRMVCNIVWSVPPVRLRQDYVYRQ